MADYEPLDLTDWCNAGPEALGDGESPAIGLQTFRGLPFLVGGDQGGGNGSRCFVSLGGSEGGVTVAINDRAHRVVFAHRLMESQIAEGGPPGLQVAEYVFRLSGGREERASVRERFEIGALPGQGGAGGRGGMPFLAVADQDAALLPRYEGRWDQLGRRQFEAERGSTQWYYLWAWANPSPDRVVESLEVVPSGPSFIIAAITLGHLDEHPFVREGKRPARIVLTDPNDADRPFDLDVDVDRGEATYVHTLPKASSDEFIRGQFKGWGEDPNLVSSPAYVEVSAVPSATVTVKNDDGEIGKVTWRDVQNKGAVETPRLRFELVDPGKNWVHVTVLDDDTGSPVPCRVHFRSPEGIPFQPHGYHNQVYSNLGTWYNDVGGDLRLGQITYAYIDGTCQGWLPRGEVVVDVARGFEYEPVRTKVNIEPGQQELTLRLKRWTNMNAQRWFSGDSHVHWLSTQGGHTEARGEDLNVVNLLQSQWGNYFTNVEDFTGEPSVHRDGNSIVYTGQENRQHFMGHILLWGLKKQLMPWCSDGLSESEIGGTLEVTLSDWADQCHEQGGTAIAAHYGGITGEASALIATGRIDGIEMISHSEATHRHYYEALNAGYRLPLVGGTDKMSADVAVGSYRTYAHIPEDQEFNHENWSKAVASGRTFLSGGPIISFTVEGEPIGSTVTLSGPGTVEVEALAECIFPLHSLEIVQAGRVVASATSVGGDRRLRIKERLKVDGHTWLAARCGGPGYLKPEEGPSGDTLDRQRLGDRFYSNWRRATFAHTSPVYVACGGEWWMFNADTARTMLAHIEGDLAYIRNSSVQHIPGTVTHPHGEADHIAHLGRPFLDARAAIEERLRKHR